ncbi:MAG TPA: hypothetical protein VFA32_14295, partial [Dehalococcoidia bacterium]|nr:hypothetical protein [Dehalococcoidia bacterium]
MLDHVLQGFLNYPLHRVRDIDDLDLTRVTTFVQEALGLQRLPVPLQRWPVIKWSCALDVDVGHPPGLRGD